MDIIKTDTFLQEAIKQQLIEGDSVTLSVTGRSMRPYLSDKGDESIIVSGFRPEDLKKGAIILFPHNNRYIFHRIIGKMNEILITQGDGNCAIEKVRSEDALGIVRFVIRKGERKVSTNGFIAQVYWRIWYILRPIRKYLLYIYNNINK